MVPIGNHLREVSDALYGEQRPLTVKLLRAHTQIADSTAIYLVDDNFILHVSPTAFPDAAAREVSSISNMRYALGFAAHVLPEVSAEGRIDGVSFMAVPRMRPLCSVGLLSRIDRIRVRGDVLAWLREVVSMAESVSNETTSTFLRCLADLEGTPGIDVGIAGRSASMSHHLLTGRVQVGHTPMHGDLWFGNLLRRADGRLCIIDWGGARSRGYGVFDLLRLGISLGVPARVMRRELRVHESLLGGQSAAQLHLLAAFGHFAGNLGEFPRDRFVLMAGKVWHSYTSIG